MERLQQLAKLCPDQDSSGLDAQRVQQFAQDPDLIEAVETANKLIESLKESETFSLNEEDQRGKLQNRFVNFYPPENVNPYVALAAKGPWIITTKGQVIYDTGGYGMLGLGHSPSLLIEAMSQEHVMANVMTANYTHAEFINKIDKEIGQTRKQSPFAGYACLNSGSEGVTLALRMSDTHLSKRWKAGSRSTLISLQGSFHGRTDRPAQVSDSCLPAYKKNLASFHDRSNLITVPPNDVEALKKAFSSLKDEQILVEAMIMEPVMGEGNPGMAITPEFYQMARELTEEAGAFLIVDSVQAGLRATGYLSILDYPGFENVDAPDCEVWSKAVNGGQYPLSVVGIRKQEYYSLGTYGNTMTGNPRALSVACAVLDQLTPDLRKNIRDKGREFVEAFKRLQSQYPDVITQVQGTGLLFSVGINPKIFDVLGGKGLEAWLRKKGLGVIHGGTNSLRFTPAFGVNNDQLNLVVDLVKEAIETAPRK